MNHSKKYVLMPEDAVKATTIPKTNERQTKRFDRDLDKIHKFLYIVLKVALRNGYNNDFSLNDINGRPIYDTNIAELLNEALSPQKILLGENDFVRLLYEAEVDSNWIVNENIKAKLLSYRPQKRNNNRSPPKPPRYVSPSPPRSPSPSAPRSPSPSPSNKWSEKSTPSVTQVKR